MVGFGLTFAFQAVAQWNNTVPFGNRKTTLLNSTDYVIYRPTKEQEEEATKVWKAKQKQSSQANGFRNLGSNCVEFAKAYLGQTGTWGKGGQNLPLNASADDGQIVIFNYTHVAVKVWKTDTQIKIIEANYIKGQVGERILDLNDPSIKGYSKF